jgi:hypothetical protein
MPRYPRTGAAQAGDRLRQQTMRSAGFLLLVALTLVMIVAPVSAGAVPAVAAQPDITTPQIVNASIWVVDFKRVNMEAGTAGADFYLSLSPIPRSR